MKKPTLPLDVPKCRRRREPESLDVYAAVAILRRHGKAVWRAGRDHHTVDGVRVSTVQLLYMADTIEATAARKRAEAWANYG